MSLTLRQKIVFLGFSQLLLLSGVLFWTNYSDAKQNARENSVARARSILLNVESTRDEMATKWQEGAFSQERLAEWAKEGRLDRVLSAVPVVTAWRTAAAKAKEGNYEFRVPKLEPRNPKNAPDVVEARVLKQFETSQAAEHYEIDHQRNAIRYFRPIRLTKECLLCHGDPATSKVVWGNDKGLDPTGVRMENWKEGEVHGAFEIVLSLDEADAQARATLIRGALIAGGLAAVSALVFFFVISRSVSQPIRDTVKVVERYAAGDLTQSLEVRSHDEIGQLQTSVNTMVGSLRRMIGEVGQCSHSLNGASHNLLHTAGELTSKAEATQASTTAASAAVQQMLGNMENMTASTEEVSANVKTIAAAVEEMTATITEVARSAEQTASIADRASSAVEQSDQKIGALGDAAQEIGKVIELIQDVAEQTSLLALNATIEAARAGEAGKGFAVVATEVKQLAKQTTQATDDIRRQVQGIQVSATDAIQALGSIREVVTEVKDASRTIATAVEEQSITTKEIAKNVAHVADNAQRVSRNVAESTAATRDVTVNIGEVDSSARSTATDAGKAHQAGALTADLAEQLRSMIGQFQT